jgi:hypothetical protein
MGVNVNVNVNIIANINVKVLRIQTCLIRSKYESFQNYSGTFVQQCVPSG